MAREFTARVAVELPYPVDRRQAWQARQLPASAATLSRIRTLGAQPHLGRDKEGFRPAVVQLRQLEQQTKMDRKHSLCRDTRP